MSTILYADADSARRHRRSTILRAAGFDVTANEGSPLEDHRHEDVLVLAPSPAAPLLGSLGRLSSRRASVGRPSWILVLAADEVTHVEALRSGADACLVEPVADDLLVAQVAALARRAGTSGAEEDGSTFAQRWRVTFDNAGVGIVEVEGADHFVAVNNRACEILGRSREELLGMNVHQLTWPEDRLVSDRFNRAVHDGLRDRVDYEKRYIKGDGSPVWAHVTVSAVRDARGRWVRSITTIEDVSGRKQAEEELLQAKALIEGITTGTEELIAAADGRLRYLYFNEAYRSEFRRLWGRDIEVGGSMAATLEPWPDQQEMAVGLWRRALDGESYSVTQEFGPSESQKQVYELRFSPVRDKQGRLLGAAHIIRNVTERLRLEGELKAAKVAAEQASRAKDHFLAVLSHELRTPLAPVLTAVAMLQSRDDLDVPTRDTMEMIRRNVELEARLIDDLLDVTRISHGKIELDRRPVELRDVLRRAVEVCMPDIEARRLEFGVDAGALPHVVDADPTRLQQVFWNLLRNAIKFTAQGGCVGIRCYPAGDSVVVEVADSGEGIEPEALSRIFNPLEQAERSITRQFGGLGLGLTISRALVDLHGGRLEAHSAGRGKGSTFRVHLPLAAGAPPVERRRPAAARATTSLRILLVEDHGDTAAMMRLLLSSDGHDVEHAGDVASALALAGVHTFDLLLSDLGLPDASGLELMRELRQRGLRLPGIALSGYGQEEDVRRSHDAGFAAHLTKPTTPEKLAEVIASVTGPAGSP